MSFVRKLFGRSKEFPASNSHSFAESQPPQNAAEIEAFDRGLTAQSNIPFYPLGQTLKNQEIRNARLVEPSSAGVSESGSHSSDSSRTYTSPSEVKKGRYQNEVPIGEGGTAVVYRAVDTRLNRPIALKRFKASSDADYLAELASASRVSHPNVVSTFDADVDAAGRYIVMEFISGQDAEVFITEQKKPLQLTQFVNFAIQALEGLHATHSGGLLHLDLKPSNIMISGQISGRSIVKLVDYGRALLVTDEQGNPPKGRGMVGSIYYSAPEQLLEQPLDVRTDLYAIGCVFYWLLTVERAFQGQGTVQVMAAHLSHLVVPLAERMPNLPQWLADWVMSLIACEKNDRPPSAQAALDGLLKGQKSQEISGFLT